MTAGQHIDYEALAQDAMRGVVRTVLAKVAETGLSGDHHFYVAFNTQATGVTISKRLKEKYPVEMTIVLQHLFWDLEVTDERFEVKLRFDGIPERLVIPFRSVKVFYDPSVPYGLQFEESELMSASGRRPQRQREADPGEEETPRPGQVERAEKRRPQRKSRSTEAKLETSPPAKEGEAKPSSAAKSTPPPVPSPVAAKPALAEAKADEPPKSDPSGAKVVDFSKFRNSKK